MKKMLALILFGLTLTGFAQEAKDITTNEFEVNMIQLGSTDDSNDVQLTFDETNVTKIQVIITDRANKMMLSGNPIDESIAVGYHSLSMHDRELVNELAKARVKLFVSNEVTMD